MIVTSGALFEKAKQGGYAVGSFNVSTPEAVRAIIEAANELKSPVMIETSPGEMNYMGAKNVTCLVKNMADNLSIPVAIHLDHGQSLEQVKEAIDAGYTSVHIDASANEYEANVKITKEAVEYAHSKGITIEGELGHIPGASESHEGENVEIDKTKLTDPNQAKLFVAATGLDILASSVGNIHGVYEDEPNLDFDRLAKIGSIGVPLSLHGGSGIPEDQVKKAIGLGITKVNVNTELRLAYSNSVRVELATPGVIVPYKYLPKATEAIKKVVKEKIVMFGSADKA